ncbi:MAG: carbohydrate kinase [Clostridia bacterium]|nr:carbohydrate kinase [Clostridia bacterium]
MVDRILCIGELLIDFICSDINVNLVQGVNFIKKAGGAPANVAAAISKLGGRTSLAAKVGKDSFGIFLKETLDEVNVDTSMIVLDEDSKTTLAFVSLKADGERDFIFNRGADGLLNYKELNEEKIIDSKIIHFGSATALLGGPSKDSYLKVMKVAQNRGIFTCFDPNYRIDLWKNNTEEFISLSKECLRGIDLVKMSDEEVKIISGKGDIKEGIKALHELGAKIVVITLGKEGTLVSNNNDMEIVPSIKIKSIDSTGAGDAFVGAFLYKTVQLQNPKDLKDNFNQIKEITYFANRVGAIVCTKLGAISSLPALKEVENYE